MRWIRSVFGGERARAATMTNDEALQALSDGATVDSVDLSGADVSNREMWDCTLRDSKLDRIAGARLYASGATFQRTSFRDADLSAANLRDSVFEACDFSGARLAGASAANATFRKCRFNGADLSGIYLQDAAFVGPIADACFVGAQLLNTSFEGRRPDTTVQVHETFESGTRLGPVVLETELAGAMMNAHYGAATTLALHKPVLVTVTSRQSKPIAEARADLIYSIDGVASLVSVFEAQSPSRTSHVLVEERPLGGPVIDLAPLPETDVRSVLVDIARITAAGHANGWRVWGIHPRLCYARRNGARLEATGISARAMRFLLGAAPVRGGLCLEPYLPFEVWRGGTVETADDVFALCALGYFLITGEHPFPGPTFDAQLAAVARLEVPRLPGPVGDVIASGLVHERALRPTAAQVVDALQA